MAKTFHLIIARIGENVFDGEVLSVSLPGREGTFEVLADHEPFVSQLRSGEIKVTAQNGEVVDFQTSGHGIAEISYNQTTVLM
jgi:F-type H+-transporting ATPase subunit epsilon